MENFIALTTLKGEKFLCNVKNIVYIGEVKGGSMVYIDEFIRYTVIETVDKIASLLSVVNLEHGKR